jgi:precorrin-2 methylase
MDSVSLIVTALASGAAETAEDGASAAVEGTYAALLATLPGQVDAEVIGGPTAVPEIWDRLSVELAEVGASGIQVATAQALMWLVDTKGSLAGQYDVDVHDEAKS